MIKEDMKSVQIFLAAATGLLGAILFLIISHDDVTNWITGFVQPLIFIIMALAGFVLYLYLSPTRRRLIRDQEAGPPTIIVAACGLLATAFMHQIAWHILDKAALAFVVEVLLTFMMQEIVIIMEPKFKPR